MERREGRLAALIGGNAVVALAALHETCARQPPILRRRLVAQRRTRAARHGSACLFLGGMVGFWSLSTQYLPRSDAAVRADGPGWFRQSRFQFHGSDAGSAPPPPEFGNAGLLTGGLMVSVVGLLWLRQVSRAWPT